MVHLNYQGWDISACTNALQSVWSFKVGLLCLILFYREGSNTRGKWEGNLWTCTSAQALVWNSADLICLALNIPAADLGCSLVLVQSESCVSTGAVQYGSTLENCHKCFLSTRKKDSQKASGRRSRDITPGWPRTSTDVFLYRTNWIWSRLWTLLMRCQKWGKS